MPKIAYLGDLPLVDSIFIYIMLRLPQMILCLSIGATCSAQSVVVLHSFTGSDGSNPYHQLITGADGYLYGTASAGGANGYGSIFRISTAGSFTLLYSFTGGADGAAPYGGVTLAPDGSYYGSTNTGGTHNQGTVFKLTLTDVDGKAPEVNLSTVHTFTGPDGPNPYGGVSLDSVGNVYGTTTGGGVGGWGAVWKLGADSTFTTLHSFSYPNGVNGACLPYNGVTLVTGTLLVGSARCGGPTARAALYEISGTTYADEGMTLDQGQWPYSDIEVETDGNFYGSAVSGGTNNAGTLFKVEPNGTISLLYTLPGASYSFPFATSTLAPDGLRYFATAYGGPGNDGQIVSLNSSGAASVVYTFDGSFGQEPTSKLLLVSDGNLYGTTLAGGANGYGVIYKLIP